MQNQVLVTGANGFIGRHVARLFSRNGYLVIGVGHGDWPSEEWKRWGLSAWFPVDVNLKNLKRWAGAPSTIVHCAGGSSVAFSINDPIADFERTVVTTAHVIEFVRESGISCRVVYPSSASVYGNVKSVPIREECQPAPISQYGVHKLMAEQMISSYSRQFGIHAAIVRLFSVYGCGLQKQLLWDACGKFAKEDLVFAGTGSEIRDWLHVEDAADLILAATGRASTDCPTVNGGSGHGVSVREVLDHLALCFSERAKVAMFSGAQRAGDPTCYVADIASSQAWGWSPKHDWKQGVAQYVSWWKTHTA